MRRPRDSSATTSGDRKAPQVDRCGTWPCVAHATGRRIGSMTCFVTFARSAGTAAVRRAFSLRRRSKVASACLLLRFLAERAVGLRELVERHLVAGVQGDGLLQRGQRRSRRHPPRPGSARARPAPPRTRDTTPRRGGTTRWPGRAVPTCAASPRSRTRRWRCSDRCAAPARTPSTPPIPPRHRRCPASNAPAAPVRSGSGCPGRFGASASTC